MDTQTRHALKEDKFAQAAASSANWVGEHRGSVVKWVVIAAVALVVVVGALIFWNVETTAANNALGEALDIFNAPLNQPGAPPEPGFYNSTAEQAKAANAKFVAVADKYGWLPVAAKAHYFAGITDQQLGQTASAETELKKAADAWDKDIANLGKMALAALYHQTGRDSQAIDIYQAVAAKPSTTVGAQAAQLTLADLYVDEGKQDLARGVWAKIKDTDKDSMAGQVAQQKLLGK